MSFPSYSNNFLGNTLLRSFKYFNDVESLDRKSVTSGYL